MSNLGRWARWYRGLTADDPQPYGDSDSYRILAEWVSDCDLVEDWGCGKGWMRRFVPDTIARYRGVDGTRSPFADIVADLTQYRSDVDGIVLRHVLEHDWNWELILRNAMASFRHRFGLALFTPLADTTHEIAYTPDVGVPDISFAEADLVAHFDGCTWTRVDLVPSPTQYGVEHIYLVERTTG
jgi:hypothetical protein